MIGNMLTTNYHMTHKHHVETIVEGKGPGHPPPIYQRGQKFKIGHSSLSPPCRPYEQNVKRGMLGRLQIIPSNVRYKS